MFSFHVSASKFATTHSGDFPRLANGLWPVHNHLNAFSTMPPRCTAFSIASRLYHRGNARFTVREGRGDGNGQDHSFLAQLLCQPFLKNVIAQILVLVYSLNLYRFDLVIGSI